MVIVTITFAALAFSVIVAIFLCITHFFAITFVLATIFGIFVTIPCVLGFIVLALIFEESIRRSTKNTGLLTLEETTEFTLRGSECDVVLFLKECRRSEEEWFRLGQQSITQR